MFRKIDAETLIRYKAKKDAGEDKDEDLNNLTKAKTAAFYPGYTEINKGTLQQRIWQKGPGGGNDLLWDEGDPYIYILVAGKERFKYEEQEVPQDYALVITFMYERQEDIQLYTKLKNKVRKKECQEERERARSKNR